MKIRKILIIGVLGFLFILVILFSKKQVLELPLIGMDKSSNINLYTTDQKFKTLQQLTFGEVAINEIAMHKDGNIVVLLYRGEDFRQTIGKYSMSEKKFLEILPIDITSQKGKSIVFLDWDVKKDRIIIATSQKAEIQNFGRFEIQTINMNTDEVRTIFVGDQNFYYYTTPTYSYNGEDEIVLDIDEEIYMITISTGEIEFIANGKYPFWTPDGNMITYFEDRGNYYFTIYNFNVNSREKEYINEGTFYIYKEGGLSWSPDGKSVFYIEARGIEDPMSIVEYNSINGKYHNYFQSDKRNVNILPVFFKNLYE